jgi:hypothetical protein
LPEDLGHLLGGLVTRGLRLLRQLDLLLLGFPRGRSSLLRLTLGQPGLLLLQLFLPLILRYLGTAGLQALLGFLLHIESRGVQALAGRMAAHGVR